MNIHENTALLDAFLDGETTPEETAEVRAHLADCPDCRAYVADAMTLRRRSPRRRMRSFRRILRKT